MNPAAFTPITRAELRIGLLAQTNSAMVSFIAVTPPDMYVGRNGVRGGDRCKFADCIKVNKVGANIAGRYDRIVENRLEKEIKTERETENLPPLDDAALRTEVLSRFRKGESWHRPIFDGDDATCLSVNKKDGDDGDAYLRVVVNSRGQAVYLQPQNGDEIPKDAIADWLKPPSKYENQGLDKPAVFLCYGLDKIVEIAIGGERLRVMDNFTQHPIETRKVLWRIAEEYLSGDRGMKKI